MQSFKPKIYPVFCALNEQELIILGAEHLKKGFISDGWILNSTTDTTKQVV